MPGAFIDHFSFPVADLARAATFYDPVLRTLGLARLKQADGAVGYGPAGGFVPIFWLLSRAGASFAAAGLGLYVSFRAAVRVQVDAFHETALVHGATDAGAPGPRPHYSAGFHGAFVLDLDGFKVEAVVREGL